MAWMRMPGQTWPGAAASFLGMWVVMMVAMMLPYLAARHVHRFTAWVFTSNWHSCRGHRERGEAALSLRSSMSSARSVNPPESVVEGLKLPKIAVVPRRSAAYNIKKGVLRC
jgi:hypothetical protein